MANNNNLSDTQLARIVAPNISDPTYANDLTNAFEIINENFRKLASAPFLQGVKGDSYTLKQYPIFDDSYHLTKDGAILLNSIFCESGHNRFSQDLLFEECQRIVNDIAKPIGQNSALSYFRNGSQYVNNYVYFQEIIDDANNPVLGSKSYGQLFYFIDGRLKDTGVALENDNAEVKAALNSFCDYSGFYQYDNSDPQNPRYIKLSLMPSIYYDDSQNDICWMFNGVKTGISAVGAPGKAGKDAVLKFVLINLDNSTIDGTKTTSQINAVGETTDVFGFRWIPKEERDFDTMLATDDSALIFIEFEHDTEASHKHNFAFGKIYKKNAGWMVSYEEMDVINNIVTFDAINQYFENMHHYNIDTPLRQFIEIPINPISTGAINGNHLIGTYCKNGSESNENGSLIVHRNSNNSNIEKHVIISGYDEIELGEREFTKGANQHFGTFAPRTPEKNLVRIKRGDSANGPEIFIENNSQYKAALRMGNSGPGLIIDGGINGSSTSAVPVKIVGSLTTDNDLLIKGNSEIVGTAKVGSNVTVLGNNIAVGSGNSSVQIKQATTGPNNNFEINIPNAIYVFNDIWNNANKKVHLYVNGDIHAVNGDIRAENGNLITQGNLVVKGGANPNGGWNAVTIGDPNNKTSTGETNDIIKLGLSASNKPASQIHSNIHGWNGEQKAIVTTLASDPHKQFPPSKAAFGDTYGPYGSFLYLLSGENNYFKANVGINVQNIGSSIGEKCVRVRPQLVIEAGANEDSSSASPSETPPHRLTVNGNAIFNGNIEMGSSGYNYLCPSYCVFKSDNFPKLGTYSNLNLYSPKKAFPGLDFKGADEKMIAFDSTVYPPNCIVSAHYPNNYRCYVKCSPNETYEYTQGYCQFWLGNDTYELNYTDEHGDTKTIMYRKVEKYLKF